MRLDKKIVLTLFLCVSASLRGHGQVRPINDYGALGLGHLLNRLNTTASVMMIGAHPDDEDSALLAYLARGENARTAYLSLTRGDGGQNIIGPELFEPLGIIRTEELLQARRLDGAEQYFTRAYDYGFSKTLSEAKSKWPEDVIKCDVVHAIRLFRPMVVISRFTGTSADGHGQHQYAGYITPIAVKAAADPKQCTDAGEPWKVLKFYVEQSFSDKTEPTLKINTGRYDPLLGRTYFEIAMEGRSMHRSQGEGRLELHGDQFSGLNLVGSTKDAHETSIFEGLNVTARPSDKHSRLSESDEAAAYATITTSAKRAIDAYNPIHPQRIVPILIQGLTAFESLNSDRGLPTNELAYKRREFVEAIRIASGIRVDALVDSETVSPGESLSVAGKAYVPANVQAKFVKMGLCCFPESWTVTKVDAPSTEQNNSRREKATATEYFTLRVGKEQKVTQPYWLEDQRRANLYEWPKWGFYPPPSFPFGGNGGGAWAVVEVEGTPIEFSTFLSYRFADPSRGEIRREVNVVPALSVGVDRDLVIVPRTNKPQTRRLVVTVTNNTSTEQSGHISLNIGATPDLKIAAPNGNNFTLKTRGAKASIPIDIMIPAKPAALEIPIRASAEVGQARYALTMNVVSYPHIQTHRYYTPADATVEVLDLNTVPVKVGYIMGSGDEVPEAIRQMGMDVTMLEEKDLASGDLMRFDTIVVGIRASETRPDLVANNARLLEYVKKGGTVVVQYQRFSWTGLAPYPVDIQDKQGTTAGSIARVVDENAPVKILDPQHPLFNFPNKITDADFNGWVQERNAYNLVTFDPQYTPLLESHDAGEHENKGGLVVAKVGKGNWVYCSYSFFRQLPAGVPGAYRIFDNLLSLPKAKS